MLCIHWCKKPSWCKGFSLCPTEQNIYQSWREILSALPRNEFSSLTHHTDVRTLSFPSSGSRFMESILQMFWHSVLDTTAGLGAAKKPCPDHLPFVLQHLNVQTGMAVMGLYLAPFRGTHWSNCSLINGHWNFEDFCLGMLWGSNAGWYQRTLLSNSANINLWSFSSWLAYGDRGRPTRCLRTTSRSAHTLALTSCRFSNCLQIPAHPAWLNLNSDSMTINSHEIMQENFTHEVNSTCTTQKTSPNVIEV